jgi:hypothetical protein
MILEESLQTDGAFTNPNWRQQYELEAQKGMQIAQLRKAPGPTWDDRD